MNLTYRRTRRGYGLAVCISFSLATTGLARSPFKKGSRLQLNLVIVSIRKFKSLKILMNNAKRHVKSSVKKSAEKLHTLKFLIAQ